MITPTTAPILLTTGIPPILFLYIISAASSIVASTFTETTSFFMISRTQIFASKEFISYLDKVVAGDGATRIKSLSLKNPTNLPSSTTGKRRKLCFFIK